MSKNSISSFLKQLRKTSGYSVNTVIDKLKEFNIEISAKTLYGYESGLSMPNADAFVALCKIYRCDNPMDIFDSPSFQQSEIKLIEKYRSLDPYGQETVNIVLDRELARTQQLQDAKNLQSTATRIYTYMHKIACAGSGYYFDDIPTDTIEAPYCEGADFIIGVSGDSMEPDYHDGENLYVRKVDTLNYGEVGIFTIGNECFLKEYAEDGLISRNKLRKDIPGTEDVRLIGKVIGKTE